MAKANVTWQSATSNQPYFLTATGGRAGHWLSRQARALSQLDVRPLRRPLGTPRAALPTPAGKPTTGGWQGVLADLSEGEQADVREEMMKVRPGLRWKARPRRPCCAAQRCHRRQGRAGWAWAGPSRPAGCCLPPKQFLTEMMPQLAKFPSVPVGVIQSGVAQSNESFAGWAERAGMPWMLRLATPLFYTYGYSDVGLVPAGGRLPGCCTRWWRTHGGASLGGDRAEGWHPPSIIPQPLVPCTPSPIIRPQPPW